MVVLTINAPSNDYTVYFDHPIPKPNYIRLISCSLYNSWYNLKKNGAIKIISKNKSFLFLHGHYTIKNFVKNIENNDNNGILEIENNSPLGEMAIFNKNGEHIEIDEDLAALLGISKGRLRNIITFIKKLNSPSTYFIHCDLIDKEKNLFNGKPSSILANFDIKGESFERIFYKSEPQHVLRETSSGNFVNSINISVKDENGELFNFNGMPLTFVLEIN